VPDLGSCGDGILQWKRGETCDPPGSVCGARGNPDWMCNDLCECKYVGYCGDGKVQWGAGEQCEPGPNDQCEEGRVCDPNTCQCIEEPEPTQACCLAYGFGCAQTRPQECLALNGVPQGPGTNCASNPCGLTTEACCLPRGFAGVCADFIPGVCGLSGGDPQGPGTNCATASCPQFEACCFPDPPEPGQGCFDVTPEFCLGLGQGGGDPRGPGTRCATNPCSFETEACCVLGTPPPFSESCWDFTEDHCLSAGSVPLGPGTNCATISCPLACCFGDGSCQDLLLDGCVSAGGDPQSPGTDCTPNLCPQPG
jgi:hypothetical protein